MLCPVWDDLSEKFQKLQNTAAPVITGSLGEVPQMKWEPLSTNRLNLNLKAIFVFN